MDTCLKLIAYMLVSYLIKWSEAFDGHFVQLSTHALNLIQFRCVCDPSCLSLQDCCFVDIASILCTLSHGMQVDRFHSLLTLVLG